MASNILNGLGASDNSVQASQMAFGMSHIVIYQELVTMRRTLESMVRRQAISDENLKNNETSLQELQPIPKRLDDMGIELNNHYASADDKIRRQEAEIKALVERLIRSDEDRVSLAQKVEQLSTKLSLQATQSDDTREANSSKRPAT